MSSEPETRIPVGPAPWPRRAPLAGRYVTLRPLDARRDVDALYEASHGDERRRAVWRYLLNAPFESVDAMLSWLSDLERRDDVLFLTVMDHDDVPVGQASFMRIFPHHRSLELGSIWYTPRAQRSEVNSETIYLMLRHAFDELGYRRVEWKCDARNTRSRAAARRLGFRFEGLFRQHMIIKGANRDTSWYAMTDQEWPTVRANLEHWLTSPIPRPSLTELNRPLHRPSIEDT